jgi:hypothetical protein
MVMRRPVMSRGLDAPPARAIPQRSKNPAVWSDADAIRDGALPRGAVEHPAPSR